mmetsp:Transcript_25153/g.54913  ORF Transcript_25153/g.54913 Transcript_25153/m.54913 type:complete len:111 (+) Transcript_25153:770-1102(+)
MITDGRLLDDRYTATKAASSSLLFSTSFASDGSNSATDAAGAGHSARNRSNWAAAVAPPPGDEENAATRRMPLPMPLHCVVAVHVAHLVFADAAAESEAEVSRSNAMTSK